MFPMVMRASRLYVLALPALLLCTLATVRAGELSIPLDKPADIKDWKSDYELWQIQDGSLTPAPFVSSSRRSMFWRPDGAFADVDLTVEFKALSEGVVGAGLGVMYRAQSSEQYYSVLIDPRPERWSAALIMATRERERPIASAKDLDVPLDTWHTLRVVAKGGAHEVFLDGKSLFTASEKTYKSGVIGLRANFAQTHFRNLKINGAEAAPKTPFEVNALPFITLAADATPGHYEGFPSLCKTKSGDLLCVFFAGYKHVPSTPNETMPKGGQIAAVRSSDNGKTWSAPFTIYDSEIDDHDPEITALSDGRLAVTICRWPVKGTHKPFIIWSSDDGKTWSDAVEVDQGQPMHATEVPQGPIVEMPSGDLVMPTYGTVAADENSSAVVRVSKDGGKTWRFTDRQVLRSPYAQDKQDKNVYEPCIVRLPDNKLLMVARQKMFRWESTDGGATWAKLDDMPFRGDSPMLLLTSKNILLCGIRFRGMEKTGKNRGTCVAYSTDLGKTWSEPIVIAPVIGAYTYMVELPDGRVFVAYYTEGNGFSDIRGAWLSVNGKGITVQGQ
jgi:hypothetical protein